MYIKLNKKVDQETILYVNKMLCCASSRFETSTLDYIFEQLAF